MSRTTLSKGSFKTGSARGLSSRATSISADDAVRQLVSKAKAISKWDESSTSDLRNYIRDTSAFGKEGDRVVLLLIIHDNPSTKEEREQSIWASRAGLDLLSWLLDHFKDTFSKTPDNRNQLESQSSNRLPLHLAIDVKNVWFLVCFLSLPRERLEKVNLIFEAVEKEREGQNVVHRAMQARLPFASAFVAVCSPRALTKTDSENYTPIHLGLVQQQDGGEKMVPNPTYRQSGRADSLGLNQSFMREDILDELCNRKDHEEILPKVLKAVAKTGSLYWDVSNRLREDPIVQRLKTLVFKHAKSIQDATIALYGDSAEVSELCLDMSDFNRSSHDFEKFVERLTDIVPRQQEMGDESDEESDDEEPISSLPGMVQFEDTLFFVNLPDLNYVKQPCSQETIRKLFNWLGERQGVKTVNRLYIPDNSLNPLSDAFMALYVLDKFTIKALDWRKLDINLDILTSSVSDTSELTTRGPRRMPTSNTREHLRELTLYSSGNWSVLYHWISEEGLAQLPKVRTLPARAEGMIDAYAPHGPAGKVSLSFDLSAPDALLPVSLRADEISFHDKGAHDKVTREYYRSLVATYKSSLKNIHQSKREQYKNEPYLNYRFELTVRTDARWDYPRPFHEMEEPTVQLARATDVLRDRSVRNKHRHESKTFIPKDDLEKLPQRDQLALKLYDHVFAIEPDRRIKIAIIDNGADKIRSPIGSMIEKGISYVSSDLLGKAPRPWWMVADAHGTQMASLIGQINPYCRLYIARVGKGRADIDPKKAAKAIRWAVEQQVDIISMSWVTKKNEPELQEAVEKAAGTDKGRRPTLMFCSTADEGAFGGPAYPVDYKKHVVSVSATDSWGGLTSKTDRHTQVDVSIPGEDLEASAPFYLGNVGSTVSGSSVATALAAGIASLALLLLQTYNDCSKGELSSFYTRDGIMRVFDRMDASKGGLQLQQLFPRDPVEPSNIHGTMASTWKIKNFPES
ncbi:hypothetical protein ATEIFO6365_0001096100 [Aspergillus terreus]|uniref:Peptidase S8/S53 domain-containing protein n=1 Tax=Aspergillus terreus TaxID=33178 RepID=A0A5M3YRH6_ASPTE|nr:hypothetical protein ATETN484_0001088200 [Aspergillus terreus]GFF12737.1 hypothetical protein ATEIFO6365_0001096100 [Aspergillus terreus]